MGVVTGTIVDCERVRAEKIKCTFTVVYCKGIVKWKHRYVTETLTTANNSQFRFAYRGLLFYS